MTADEMIRDLRSVKVRPAERARVDRLRVQFQAYGSLPTADERWLHETCRRYRLQLDELHAARERALRTNSLRTLGLSQAEVQRRVAARWAEQAARADDLGI